MKDKEYVMLNVRSGLTRETRDKMRKICELEEINFGELLVRTFGR